MWTRIAQTNLKRKNLNVDAAEVKYSNNIEGEVEEIILLRAAETNKPINLPKGVKPVPSRIHWRQPWRRSERPSRNKDEGWRTSQASSCMFVMDNALDCRTLSLSTNWYFICLSIPCFYDW
jgi:hypothetical protein